MSPGSHVLLALLALCIEAGLGYPAFVYRAIRHPVTWIGASIAILDAGANREALPDGARRLAGACALLAVVGGWGGLAFLVERTLAQSGIGSLVLVLIAASLPAQRSLDLHVRSVAARLEGGDLRGAREAVGMIVGRDVASLDASGVARAAIESLAENFSDGVVAPALWTALLGLGGGVAYKAANTADSMIGHRNARFEAFGWAAARFDDLVNLPASRLGALALVAAARICRADASGAWQAVRRDARLHRSPNAGWPEAAMAGALGLKLAGPRSYGGVTVPDAFIGQGRTEAKASDIRRALRLYRAACVLQIACLVALTLILPG